jgi:hypothetical protein
MQAGDTFLPDAGGSHLWVVLSDPDANPDKVLLVSLTTWNEHKEQTCIVNRGEHEWVTHRSCVAYGMARIVTRQQLVDGRNSGALRVQAPLAAALLQRIRERAGDSERLSEEAFDILLEQGLAE